MGAIKPIDLHLVVEYYGYVTEEILDEVVSICENTSFEFEGHIYGITPEDKSNIVTVVTAHF